MKHNFHSTNKENDNQIVLEYDDEPFKGVQWTFGAMQFADKENEDGSMNMSFDFNIVSDHKLSDDEHTQFGKITGEILLQILEEQIEKNEVIYKGGSGEAKFISD